MLIDERDQRTIVMAEVMTPDKANFSGKIHGGHLMAIMDRVAYACAARYCAHYVVTLSVDQVTFKKPVYIGELLTFYASVNFVGKTSMEIGIRVIAENLETRELRHTNTCYFTMVALDQQGSPIEVPPLELRTAEEKRRFEEAKLRRSMRKEYETRHEQDKAKIKEIIDKLS